MAARWRTPWLRPMHPESVYLRPACQSIFDLDYDISLCRAHVEWYFDVPSGAEVRFELRRPARHDSPGNGTHVVTVGGPGYFDLTVHSSPRRCRGEILTRSTLNWLDKAGVPAGEELWLSCEYRETAQ